MNKFSRWAMVVLGVWAMNDQGFGQLSVVRIQLPSTLLALKPDDPKYIKVAAKQIENALDTGRVRMLSVAFGWRGVGLPGPRRRKERRFGQAPSRGESDPELVGAGRAAR